jgi:hypothetical protein
MAESAPFRLELAHQDLVAEEADDVPSVARIVGLLVGQRISREGGGRRSHCPDPMRPDTRFAGTYGDLDVDGDMHPLPCSRMDLHEDSRQPTESASPPKGVIIG